MQKSCQIANFNFWNQKKNLCRITLRQKKNFYFWFLESDKKNRNASNKTSIFGSNKKSVKSQSVKWDFNFLTKPKNLSNRYASNKTSTFGSWNQTKNLSNRKASNRTSIFEIKQKICQIATCQIKLPIFLVKWQNQNKTVKSRNWRTESRPNHGLEQTNDGFRTRWS